jgi:transposase
MHMLAALDLTMGKIHYRIRRRKRHAEFLDLLKTPRARWPGQRLYLIMDNLSPHPHPHPHPDARDWAADSDTELVFLPTYSSWLNRIEAEFAAPRYFALNGTDHHTHTEQNAAIGSIIR